MYYNVLLGKTATASSTWSNYFASNVVDGSKRFADYGTTRWVSASSKAGEWLQVDIGSMAKIDRLVLYTGNNSSDGYTTDNAIKNGDMQINQNGQWVTVASFRDNPASNQKVVMDLDKPVVTDKVRLYFPIDEQQYRVFEIEAYGEVLSKNKKEYPNKNLILPFQKWEVYDNSDVKIIELTNRRLAFELNATKAYQGIGMPIDSNFVRTVAGKSVTFSAGKYNKYTYNAQIHLRFSGSASGNIDLVLGNSISTTKFIPADVTGAFLHIQTNEVGFSKYEVEDLQLEVGSVQTAYEPYKESSKRSTLHPNKNLITSQEAYDSVGTINFSRTTDNKYVFDWTAGFDAFIRNIKVKPYTNYTISMKKQLVSNDVTISVRDKNSVTMTATSTASQVTFNSGNTDSIILRFARANTVEGKVIVSDLQLEEGSTATAYEPYRLINKKAVAEVPQTNLVNPDVSKWSNGSADGAWTFFVDNTRLRLNKRVQVLPNTKYTLKVEQGYQIYVRQFASETTFEVGSSAWRDDGYVFITDSSVNYLGVIVRRMDNRAINPSELAIAKPMVAKGFITENLPYKIGNTIPRSATPKKAYKSYPFNTLRESAEIVDGIEYEINQPRLRNGGLLIEEATTNLLGSGIDLTKWTGQFNGYVELVKEGYKLYKTTDNISRIAWSKIPASGGKQYTFTVWAKAGTSNRMQIELSDPTMINTCTLTDEFKPYSVTNTVNKTGNIYAYIYGAMKDAGNVGDIIIQKVQVEEKGYSTSYTENMRKADKITVPNTTGYIDPIAGSIYIKYSYEDLANAKLSSGFIFDSSASARWFANYDVGNQKIQCVINGLALIQFTPDKMKKDNEMLIQWNQKTMTVTYNGNVSTYTNQTTGANAPIGTISLGTRFSLDNAWLGGTMHEFVIKDRNENITYRI